MKWLKKKSKYSLGIDIGASTIKLVELEREKEHTKLRTYGILPVIDYLHQAGQESETETPKLLDDQVAGMIGVMIKQADVKSKSVRLSDPEIGSSK